MTVGLDVLDEQTQALLATVDAMAPEDLAGDSLLPEWSRGHVLAHIAGNAEGLGRRARFAIDGVPRAMYESLDSRSADVEWRASRSREQHREALAATHADLRRDLEGIPAVRYDDEIELRPGILLRVGQIPLLRLQEVCIHHADLGLASYTWRDWPGAMVEQVLPRVIATFRSRDAFPIAWIEIDGKRVAMEEGQAGASGVSGAALPVLAWLTGRSDGEGLTPTGRDGVPEAPPWL